MPANISDTLDSMTFQATMTPKMVRKNRMDYAMIEGVCENENVSVEFELQVKYNYVKKHPTDLIKNDHIILQNRKEGFFFLFEVLKSKFSQEEDGSLVYDEAETTGNYQYTVHFCSKKAEPAAEPVKTGNQGWTGDVSADVSAILEKYGLSDKAEGYSPVTEYMKKWSLEHPEQEWDIHGDKSE